MQKLRNILFCILMVSLHTLYAEDAEIANLTVEIRNKYAASDYTEVVGLCNNAIEKISQSQGYNVLTLTRLVDYKAMSLRMLGDYHGAESCYIEEIQLLEDYPSRIDNARCKLGVLYTEMGLYKEAEEALSSIQSTKYKNWSDLHRASLYVRQGDRDKALHTLQGIIDSCKDEEILISAHQNYGYIQMDSKDEEEQLSAKRHLMYALERLPSDQLLYQSTLGNIALLEAKMGEYVTSLKHIEDVIRWYEKEGHTSAIDYKIAIRKKAEILYKKGEYSESAKIYKKYFAQEKRFAQERFYSMTEQNRLDFWKTLRPHISKIFALEDECAEFLLDVSLFRREVALLGSAEKREMTQRLKITGEQIRKSLKGHEVAIDFVRYLKGDTAMYGAIIIPSITKKSPVRFVPLWEEEELHGYLIGDGTRLDEALCSDRHEDKDKLYTDEKLSQYLWSKLDSEILKYDYEDVYFVPDGLLQLMAIEYIRDDNGVFLHRLSSLTQLLDRDKHKITRDSKMLAVGGLDFDQIERQEEFGQESNHDAIHYLQEQIRGIDHPFTYLQGAKMEIDTIKGCSTFDIDTTSVQTEHQLKEQIKEKRYRLLHLSTHGYSLDVRIQDIPEALSDSITEDRTLLATGIAMTGANIAYKEGCSEDGIISAREFCEMDMTDIDLIILSACQTGLGRLSDEGPAGLVRGLKKAGAGALIVSLWSVDDEATMLFMKHLYKTISEQSKPDIHAAFNAARINFSKETRQMRTFDSHRLKTIRVEESFNQPRYCNSFILIDGIKH